MIAGVAARIACVFAGPGAVRSRRDRVSRDGPLALGRSRARGRRRGCRAGRCGCRCSFARGSASAPSSPATRSSAWRRSALAAAIARELGRDARMTAAITAIVPSLATMPRLLVSENLALPLFALATLLLVRAANRRIRRALGRVRGVRRACHVRARGVRRARRRGRDRRAREALAFGGLGRRRRLRARARAVGVRAPRSDDERCSVHRPRRGRDGRMASRRQLELRELHLGKLPAR